MKRLKFD